MLKFVSLLAISLTALAAAAPASASLGPDAPVCSAGGPALLVSVNGFKARSGRLRVQLYGDNPNTFLAKGARLKRIDLPVTAGTMNVCVAVPHPGTYAIAVRHDVNGDNSKGDWSDGGGFSNNPSLSLLHLKPSLRQTAVNVGNGVKPVSITLLYRHGFSIGPAGQD